jgi:putative tryptophan/tyrosine transport system substrate-binding protein
MDRRAFIAVIGGTILAVRLTAEAQPASRAWRIGYLTPTEISRAELIEALRQLGYIEGQTFTLEVRSAANNLDRLPALAVTLVTAKVDVIVAVSPPAIRAASRATRSIPIIMRFWGGEGLLESGIVASFARPGTNVTGIYMLAAELDAKRLHLLLEALPTARKVAVLNPGRDWGAFSEVRRVAEAAKIQLYMTEVPGASGYQRVFEGIAKEHDVDALLVPSFPRFFQDHRQIIELAARRAIPAIYEWGDNARAGGLMSYGPVRVELDRRAAIYIDKILKGVPPADLPVEQPTTFELVINLKTAKALGLTIPQTLLLRADQVIE